MGKKTAAVVEIIIALLFLRFCVSQVLVQRGLALLSRQPEYYQRQAAAEKALPLTIGDLTDYSDEDYKTDISKTTTAQEGKRSFAAYTQKARLTADLEEGQPEKLLYTVSTGSPGVIDAYVEETLQKMEEETMDGSAWRAEEGYYTSDDGEYRYLLVWGTRAIDITFGWEPTAEQLDSAINTLLK